MRGSLDRPFEFVSEMKTLGSPGLRLPSASTAALLDGALTTGFVRDVALTFGARLLGVATGVITLTMTTRLLGPEGRGQFAVIMAVLALVLQLSNFGLHSSSIYHLARRPELQMPLGSLLFWFSLLGVGLVAALAYALAARVPVFMQSVPLSLLGLALAAAPPAMFLLLGSNALLGLGKTIWFNALDLGVKLVGLISVVLLFWWPLTALFTAYAVLHYLLACLVYTRLIGSRFPAVTELSLASEILSYGLRAFLVAFFMFLVLRVDLFLVNSLLGTTEAGQYSVAVQVSEILNLAVGSVAVILFPHLSGLGPEQRWHSAWRVTRITGAVLGLGILVLALVSRPLFIGWFGVQFAPAVLALWWLLPGLWCLGINTILYQHLAASGLPWFLVGATCSTAIINILLNLELIPRFGIAGAAGASSASYALLLGFTFWYLRKGWMRGSQA